jgi:hypothetical protein
MGKKTENATLAGVSEAEAIEAEQEARVAVLAAEQALDEAHAEHRLAKVRVNAARCHPADAAAGSVAGSVADAEAALQAAKARAAA